ncbi:hypothetical protein ACFWUP_29955 [Nocardia sp. NPDC058658]|uniref:hypothetical protein n=1 Tax=Nocardia sp. NPDC058658 TaxID=3346580 RepID=UPI003657C518
MVTVRGSRVAKSSAAAASTFARFRAASVRSVGGDAPLSRSDRGSMLRLVHKDPLSAGRVLALSLIVGGIVLARATATE